MSGRPARVQGRRTFQALSRSSRRAGDRVVRVHFVPSEGADGEVRVAYSINRKVGGAVSRNRCRRRLRAIAAEAAGELSAGSYLISVGPDVHDLGFQGLRTRVVDTMRKASEGRR